MPVRETVGAAEHGGDPTSGRSAAAGQDGDRRAGMADLRTDHRRRAHGGGRGQAAGQAAGVDRQHGRVVRRRDDRARRTDRALTCATPEPGDPATAAALDVVAALPAKVQGDGHPGQRPHARVGDPEASPRASRSSGATRPTRPARRRCLAALTKAQAHPPVVLDRHGNPLPPPTKANVYDVSSPDVATVKVDSALSPVSGG